MKPSEWVGMEAETLTEISNRVITVPRGSRVLVVYARSGLQIVGRPCQHCGIQARVMGVAPSRLRPVRRVFDSPRWPVSLSSVQERSWAGIEAAEE